MKKLFAEAFKREVSKDQSKDTGMAMVLLLLILYLMGKREAFILPAVLALLLNMTWPQAYRPVAVVWLGCAQLLGRLASKMLLSVVFFVIVTPVGLVRRRAGKDVMKLGGFKANGESVMVDRNHVFTGGDIANPY